MAARRHLPEPERRRRRVLSCLELYDDLRDLLAPARRARPLKIVEAKGGTIDVDGCVEAPVADAAAALDLVRGALASRKTACHDMNADSSRSHFVTSLRVTAAVDGPASSVVRLVDLAGSGARRQDQATGATLDEAKRINSSLSALGNVISAPRAGRAQAADRVAHAAKLEAAKAEDAAAALRFELGRATERLLAYEAEEEAPRRRRARGLRAEPRLLRREPRRDLEVAEALRRGAADGDRRVAPKRSS
ncbi:hypothetical protein JL721_11848 [Aureococcus anophagefferens]|nr:hypothetical protein JL721_11848 [Aureococcus anophagefferens]